MISKLKPKSTGISNLVGQGLISLSTRFPNMTVFLFLFPKKKYLTNKLKLGTTLLVFFSIHVYTFIISLFYLYVILVITYLYNYMLYEPVVNGSGKILAY